MSRNNYERFLIWHKELFKLELRTIEFYIEHLNAFIRHIYVFGRHVLQRKNTNIQ